MQIALSLPNQMKRKQRTLIHCEYCHADEFGVTTPYDQWSIRNNNDVIEGNVELNTLTNEIWYTTTSNLHLVSGKFKANFCPKCGRDLRREEDNW